MRTKTIPADFPAHAMEPARSLANRHGVGMSRIAAWRRELGIVVPPGAPKGNGNALRNQSTGKQTHGIDGIDAVRTCLSCTRPRCSGSCMKVH